MERIPYQIPEKVEFCLKNGKIRQRWYGFCVQNRKKIQSSFLKKKVSTVRFLTPQKSSKMAREIFWEIIFVLGNNFVCVYL